MPPDQEPVVAAPAPAAPPPAAPAPVAAPAAPPPKESLVDALKSGLGLHVEGEPPPTEEPPDDDLEPPTDEPPVVDPNAPPVAAKPAATDPKAPDPDLLKMPEGLNEKSRGRFQKLADAVKERDQQLEQQQQRTQALEDNAKALAGWFQQSGTTPEQFGQTMNVLEDVNSGDQTRMKRARNQLFNMARELSVRIGEAPEAIDPLDGFDDLKKAVADFKVTPEHASELALSRRRAALHQQDAQRNQQVAQQRAQVNQQQQATQQQLDAAQNDINALYGGWSKADPDFSVKMPALLQAAERIGRYVPPAQWAAELRAAYEGLGKLQMRRTVPARTPQPIRAGGANGSPASPSNMADAIVQGLGITVVG